MRALMLGLLWLLSAAVSAQTTSPHWPLKQTFTRNAAVLQLPREAVAEVCEGEDCTRFVLAGADSLETVHDFAYLYLWLVRNYDLAPYKGKDGKRFIESILAKRKGTCSSGANEEAVGRCVLARMAATYPVKGLVNKFEDGWRKTVPVDLVAEMRQAGILK
jgi:hypothetical protein